MLDRGTIDLMVLIVCIASASFAAGLWIAGQNDLATQCVPQAGEKLVSVEQGKTGVTCHFRKSYGMSVTTRKA